MVAMQFVVDRIRSEYSKGSCEQPSKPQQPPQRHHHQPFQPKPQQLLLYGLQHEFQNQENRILAFSDGRRYGTSIRHEDNFRKLKSATEAGRILLSDRKGWTDHLTTPNLVKSVSFIFHLTLLECSSISVLSVVETRCFLFVRVLTYVHVVSSQVIRVAAIQSSNMFATYLQDQFQADYAREELVKEGKLSAKKADEQQEEWEEVRCNVSFM
jgi:hypothetical protein